MYYKTTIVSIGRIFSDHNTRASSANKCELCGTSRLYCIMLKFDNEIPFDIYTKWLLHGKLALTESYISHNFTIFLCPACTEDIKRNYPE